MSHDRKSPMVVRGCVIYSARPGPAVRAAAVVVLFAAVCLWPASVHAFRVIDVSLSLELGIARWNADLHYVDGVERSLDGGLRYSVSGGSYEAFRDLFFWQGTPPSVPDFQSAVEQAFANWEAIDPATGLGTDLRFVPDFDTPVFLEPIPTTLEGRLRLNRGAEIDIIAAPLTSLGHLGQADNYGDPHANSVTLASGVSHYPAVVLSGADIRMNNNRRWQLSEFQRVLSHEVGHAIGLDDADRYHDWHVGGFVSRFYDDNYDDTSPATALATLTNSFAHLIDPLDPDNSPGLALYDVCTPTDPNDLYSCFGNPGIDTPGVEIHMESTMAAVFGPQNDDFAGRQFLYPSVPPPVELAGDYNGNGQIEQGDLDLVLLNWGSDTIPLEWTKSPPIGAVDQQELDAVLLNWGSGAPLAASSVPEPGTLLQVLALLAMIPLWAVLRIGSRAPSRSHACPRLIPVWLLIAVVTLCSVANGQGRTFTYRLQHDGRIRSYLLYIPEAYTGDGAWPLVLNMHGATSNGSEQMSISGMNRVADAGEFLVAYPNAVGGLWNDVLSPTQPDDLGFIEALIDELTANFKVDSSRVYSTGFSQGGAMSYLAANAIPERIAAIASVSGSPAISDTNGPLPVDLTVAPTTARPVPLLYFVGSADTIQYSGGRIEFQDFFAEIPPFSDVLEAWAVNNGCELQITTTELPDLVIDDGPTTVSFNEFNGCDCYRDAHGNDVVAEVSYFLIQDGGHTWPGGADLPGLGNRNLDIDASEEIWSFFSRHALPLAIDERISGDYNGNGQVEQGDLDLVLLHWGSDTIPLEWAKSPPIGAVDQQELDAVLLNWGSGAAPLAASSVPEPSGLLLALAAIARFRVLGRSFITQQHPNS